MHNSGSHHHSLQGFASESSPRWTRCFTKATQTNSLHGTHNAEQELSTLSTLKDNSKTTQHSRRLKNTLEKSCNREKETRHSTHTSNSTNTKQGAPQRPLKAETLQRRHAKTHLKLAIEKRKNTKRKLIEFRRHNTRTPVPLSSLEGEEIPKLLIGRCNCAEP